MSTLRGSASGRTVQPGKKRDTHRAESSCVSPSQKTRRLSPSGLTTSNQNLRRSTAGLRNWSLQWVANPVPAPCAERLQGELWRRGFPSTVCLEGYARDARLEPWPGVELEGLRAALDELRHRPD